MEIVLRLLKPSLIDILHIINYMNQSRLIYLIIAGISIFAAAYVVMKYVLVKKEDTVSKTDPAPSAKQFFSSDISSFAGENKDLLCEADLISNSPDGNDLQISDNDDDDDDDDDDNDDDVDNDDDDDVDVDDDVESDNGSEAQSIMTKVEKNSILTSGLHKSNPFPVIQQKESPPHSEPLPFGDERFPELNELCFPAIATPAIPYHSNPNSMYSMFSSKTETSLPSIYNIV